MTHIAMHVLLICLELEGSLGRVRYVKRCLRAKEKGKRKFLAVNPSADLLHHCQAEINVTARYYITVMLVIGALN